MAIADHRVHAVGPNPASRDGNKMPAASSAQSAPIDSAPRVRNRPVGKIADTGQWHDLWVSDILGATYAREGGSPARCARLGDRTIVWTHVQFAVTEFGSPLTAMYSAPFRGHFPAKKS